MRRGRRRRDGGGRARGRGPGLRRDAGDALAPSADARSDDGVVFLASSAGGLYAGSQRAAVRRAQRPGPARRLRPRQARDGAARRAPRRGDRAPRRPRPPVQRLRTRPDPRQAAGPALASSASPTPPGRPLPVFVSMDTIRDYLYAPDAGRMVERAVALARGEPPGTVVTKVLASRHARSPSGTSSPRPAGSSTARCAPSRSEDAAPGRCSTCGWSSTRLARGRRPRRDDRSPAGLARTGADVRARVISGGPLDG